MHLHEDVHGILLLPCFVGSRILLEMLRSFLHDLAHVSIRD